MMVSFVLSFFPRDVLDEILNLIESVSEDFPSYSFRTVEIVKERSWAMPFFNILIYNKVINQTAKPAVHVQNMSGLNILQIEVNYVLSRIKHNS